MILFVVKFGRWAHCKRMQSKMEDYELRHVQPAWVRDGDVHASQGAGEQWSVSWQGACGRTKTETGLEQSVRWRPGAKRNRPSPAMDHHGFEIGYNTVILSIYTRPEVHFTNSLPISQAYLPSTTSRPVNIVTPVLTGHVSVLNESSSGKCLPMLNNASAYVSNNVNMRLGFAHGNLSTSLAQPSVPEGSMLMNNGYRQTDRTSSGNSFEPYTERKGLDAYQKPYPHFYDDVPYPHDFKIPNFDKFSGENSRTTFEHIVQFHAQCGEAGALDTLKLRLFPLSLSGIRLIWFSSIAPNSIHTWSQLEKMFHKCFYARHS
jgi:hypothetical protein